MLELLGTVVSSIIGGGATGILGVIAQRFADYKNRQLDIQAQESRQAHEVALRTADAAILAQEWAARTKVADIEAAGKVDTAKAEAAGKEAEADAAAFAASYKLEPIQFSACVKPTRGQAWLLILLDVFRGAIRPGLSVYLCVLATLVYLEVKKLGGPISQGQAYDLLKLVIGTILYLWTTCTLWWFGTRNKGAQPK